MEVLLRVNHSLVKRVVEQLQLFFQIRIFFFIQSFLELFHFIITIDEVQILISLFVWVFCVDDQLFKSEQTLHLLFVHFCIYNVFQKDQLVQLNSKVIAGNHHSCLSLDFHRRYFVDWF